MTLCKFLEERKYPEQFRLDAIDVYGLVKKLDEAIGMMGEAGLASTPYYVGAYLAFNALFYGACEDGEVDKWRDFFTLFESKLQELEGV